LGRRGASIPFVEGLGSHGGIGRERALDDFDECVLPEHMARGQIVLRRNGFPGRGERLVGPSLEPVHHLQAPSGSPRARLNLTGDSLCFLLDEDAARLVDLAHVREERRHMADTIENGAVGELDMEVRDQGAGVVPFAEHEEAPDHVADGHRSVDTVSPLLGQLERLQLGALQRRVREIRSRLTSRALASTAPVEQHADRLDGVERNAFGAVENLAAERS
jgi:hypothetical protein